MVTISHEILTVMCVRTICMGAVNRGNVFRACLRALADRLGVGEQVLIPVDDYSARRILRR